MKQYKLRFTVGQLYVALTHTPTAAAGLVRNSISGLIDKPFVERIMLAVTEVNGCPICSYAHTRIALNEGMTNDEIHSMLSGEFSTIPQDQVKAVLFAQHYADAKAHVDPKAYAALEDAYGQIKARIILSAVQMIYAANLYGIPYSALISRMKGNPYADSSLAYELSMELGGLFLFPLAFIHGLTRRLFGRPNIRFAKA
jgi:AhpD family alkylhydroperoxidase